MVRDSSQIFLVGLVNVRIISCQIMFGNSNQIQTL